MPATMAAGGAWAGRAPIGRQMRPAVPPRRQAQWPVGAPANRYPAGFGRLRARGCRRLAHHRPIVANWRLVGPKRSNRRGLADKAAPPVGPRAWRCAAPLGAIAPNVAPKKGPRGGGRTARPGLGKETTPRSRTPRQKPRAATTTSPAQAPRQGPARQRLPAPVQGLHKPGQSSRAHLYWPVTLPPNNGFCPGLSSES